MFHAIQSVGKAVSSSIFNTAYADAPPRKPRKEEVIGDFTSSGIFLKDHVEVKAIPDPKVDGITVHVSTVRDARLKPRFWGEDPGLSSLAVSQTDDVTFVDNINMSKSGEEVFSESKSLMFKTLRIRRIYDKTNNALVYVSYVTNLSSNANKGTNAEQYKTSVCAVPLRDKKPPGIE